MNPENQPIRSGQKWKIDRFQPEDAVGVTRLFLSVYGAGYPIRAYIDPELLKRENAAGRIISVVAKTEDGSIVGHNALFQSAPCKKIYEAGAGLVHAEYRGGHGIFTEMVIRNIEIGRDDFGVELVYGEAVCNHVFSQKMCNNTGFISRAFEADLMPAVAYSKEKSATGRVSTLLGSKTLKSHPHTVHLPKHYNDQLKLLYETLDDERRFALADKTPDAPTLTRLETEFFDFAGVARIAVLKIGADFTQVIKKEEQRLKNEKVAVFQVWLNLGKPEAGFAAASLSDSGYFLGGLLPRWFDTDGLLMQKTVAAPNWDLVKLHFDSDRKIVEMAKQDWLSLGSAT